MVGHSLIGSMPIAGTAGSLVGVVLKDYMKDSGPLERGLTVAAVVGLVTGAVGGVVNWLLLDPASSMTVTPVHAIVKGVLAGLNASNHPLDHHAASFAYLEHHTG
jgi:hypothetical protein